MHGNFSQETDSAGKYVPYIWLYTVCVYGSNQIYPTTKFHRRGGNLHSPRQSVKGKMCCLCGGSLRPQKKLN